VCALNNSSNKNKLKQQIQQSQKQYDQQEYKEIVKKHAPKPTVFKNCVGAFLMGGTICAVAQVFFNLFSGAGLVERDANTAVVMLMIFIGAFLTGLGVYDSIVKIGGAGSIVPITGFANSIVAPAMEFKCEGFVFGVAAKMFSIAGPVLVYGFITSVIIGLIAFMFM